MYGLSIIPHFKSALIWTMGERQHPSEFEHIWGEIAIFHVSFFLLWGEKNNNKKLVTTWCHVALSNKYININECLFSFFFCRNVLPTLPTCLMLKMPTHPCGCCLDCVVTTALTTGTSVATHSASFWRTWEARSSSPTWQQYWKKIAQSSATFWSWETNSTAIQMCWPMKVQFSVNH